MSTKTINTVLATLLVVLLLAIGSYFLFFNKSDAEVNSAANQESQNGGVPFNYEGFKEPDLNPGRPSPTTSSNEDDSANNTGENTPEEDNSNDEFIPTLYLPENAPEESIAMTMCNVSRMGQNVENQKNIDAMKKFLTKDLASRIENPSNGQLQRVQEVVISSNGDFDKIVSACNG